MDAPAGSVCEFMSGEHAPLWGRLNVYRTTRARSVEGLSSECLCGGNSY
jgi:hypothetical protein